MSSELQFKSRLAGDGYARRFQVLIDGRSIYSPDFGQVSWRNLPLALDDIDRIEVIRGPAGPTGTQAFRLEYSRAYRVPTSYELLARNSYLDDGGTGDPADDVVYQTLLAQDLESGRVVSHALGWLLQLPQHGLQIDARAFHDHYKDLIDVVLVSTGDGHDYIYQFVNEPGSVTLHGVEFQVEWRPRASTRVYLAPAWARIRSDDSRIEDSAPPFSLSVLVDQKINARWRASAGYYHSGAMTWLGGGSRVAHPTGSTRVWRTRPG